MQNNSDKIKIIRIDSRLRRLRFSLKCTTKYKFNNGGYQWAIDDYPHHLVIRTNSEEHRSLYLHLLSEVPEKVMVLVSFGLVDQSRKVSTTQTKSGTFTYFQKGTVQGFENFMDKSVLCDKKFVKWGRFTIEYNLKIIDSCVKDVTNEYSILVPPSELQQHLDHLFQSGAGADVSFKVKDKTFSAHRIILAARSVVFYAEFLGSMRESKEDCIEIQDIKPEVFKALLRYTYIYTDMLHTSDGGTNEGADEDVMAQHLIVAADRYGLDRLRLICEDKLARKVGADNVVSTLALAAQHNCEELKARCLDYMSTSDSLISFIETDVFASLMVSYPSVYKELMVKVIAKK